MKRQQKLRILFLTITLISIGISFYSAKYAFIPTIKYTAQHKIGTESFDWKSLPILKFFLSISGICLISVIGKCIRTRIVNYSEEREIRIIGASGCGRTQTSYYVEPFSPEIQKLLCQRLESSSGLFNLSACEDENSGNSGTDAHCLIFESGENQANPKILSECNKCKYWHGQVHGNNLLVCGIHPYGREKCPDFELKK